VGWTPRASVLKEAQVFLAHFYTLTAVTKTDTDTFSRFLVLRDMFLQKKQPGGNPVRVYNKQRRAKQRLVTRNALAVIAKFP